MHEKNSGFTLVEVVIALFLIGMGVLAAAPMFMYAMHANAVGGEKGAAGALGVEQMEDLRAQPFSSLTAGGSLTVNIGGYSDTSDPDFTVRFFSARPISGPLKRRPASIFQITLSFI